MNYINHKNEVPALKYYILKFENILKCDIDSEYKHF